MITIKEKITRTELRRIIKEEAGRYWRKAGNVKISGYFNIYQAHNGKIYLLLNKLVTPLTLKQLKDLQIDVFKLDDFDPDLYKKAYGVTK